MTQSPPTDVILVEDDGDLRDILVTSMTYFGLRPRGVPDAIHLDAEYLRQATDILVLDLNLPGEDGSAIAKRYRRNHPEIGIVMLTAKGDRDSRIHGYADGADLYFVKPVDHEELATALKNLARRLSPNKTSWLLDISRCKIIAPNGIETDLTHNESLIMCALAEGEGDIVKRSRLYRATHDPDDAYAAQRLETALSRLRGKLKRAGLPALPVKACHGVGYALVEEVRIVGRPPR